MFKLAIAFLNIIIATDSFSQSKASTSASVIIETSLVGMTSSPGNGSTTFIVTPLLNHVAGFKVENTSKALGEIDSKIVELMSFSLVGPPQEFSITLPAAEMVASTHIGSETIQLSSFTSSNINRPAGKQTIAINGTVRFSNKVIDGQYASNTPFTVMVNYN